MEDTKNREINSSQQKLSSSTENNNITRKDFINIAKVASGGMALTIATNEIGKLIKHETTKSPELEKEPSVAVFDVFDIDSEVERFLKENFPEDFSAEETWESMGMEEPQTIDSLKKAEPKNELQARLVMLKIMQLHYKDHGESVVGVTEATSKYLGVSQEHATVKKISIADAVSFGETEFNMSEKPNNPTQQFHISSEKIATELRNIDENVINMSFELGDFTFTFRYQEEKVAHPENQPLPNKQTVGEHTTYSDNEGKPITEEEFNAIIEKASRTEVALLEPNDRSFDFKDGYAVDNAAKNLLEMVRLAHQFPDKTFVVAGGNPFYENGKHWLPDITKVREEMTEKGLWPENLLIVGFEGVENGVVGPASFGADIYVRAGDLEALGYQQASSYATPAITVVVTELQKLYPKNWRNVLLKEATRNQTFSQGSKNTNYKLLDFEKTKKIIQKDNLVK